MLTTQERERIESQAHELYASVFRPEGGFDFEERARTLGKVLALYRELGDPKGQARVLTKLGNTASNVADYAAAVDYLHEAQDLAAQAGDEALARDVRGQIFGVHMEMEDWPTALGYARREWEEASKSDDAQARLYALDDLGCVLSAVGEHAEAVQRLQESMAYLPRIEPEARRSHFHSQFMADLASAFLKWGKAQEALEHAELGIRIARGIDHSPLEMLNCVYSGRAALALGRAALAVAKLEPAIELTTRMGLKSQEMQARYALADALAALGRHELAFDSYRQGHRIERDNRRDTAARRLEFRRARKEIEDANRERESAERMLFTVLPKAIATRMKGGEARIADEIRDVSVLFADLVGFTALSTRTHPRHLLELLERIFSEFDRLTTAFALEKVKTIGDAYMTVGGALAPDPDHLGKSARLGLEMLRTAERLNTELGTNLAIRIGLHAGPAIAGVIGASRLSYDLWGETVNLASRLESSGAPGRIHVSAAIAERLRGEFTFDSRGAVALKGFGDRETWFLGAPRAAQPR